MYHYFFSEVEYVEQSTDMDVELVAHPKFSSDRRLDNNKLIYVKRFDQLSRWESQQLPHQWRHYGSAKY